MTAYEPSILWSNIAWPAPLPQMLKLPADYYDAVPEGVINDRWMHRNWMMKLLSLGPAPAHSISIEAEK